MVRLFVGSVILVLVAVLSASPALAAPPGGSVHVSHFPYKDYHSKHPLRRQNAKVPTSVTPCMLAPGDFPTSGDQEFVSKGVRYSQACLEKLGLSLVPEERTVCRTECPTCTSTRGYDLPCIAERVTQRSAEGDLTQFKDIQEPTNRMNPTELRDCLVPREETVTTPSDSNWTPVTLAGADTFDNDCLTRFYLDKLSPTASCPPNDNTCMIDHALNPMKGVEDPAVPNVPLNDPVDKVPANPGPPHPNA